MATVWILFAAVVAVGSLEFKWKFVPLVGWIAIFAIVTFLLFAVPLIGFTSANWQLRYWYVLLALSCAWSLGLISLFSHESPVLLFTSAYPGNIAGFTLVTYAALSVAIYVLLLRLRLSRRRPAASARSEANNARF